MATKEQVDKEFWDNPELQQFIIPHVTVSRTEDGLNREENSGAYAVVKKVKFNGIEFAAKVIHRLLIQPGSVVVDNYIRECRLMSTISHANIVQFVGLCHLPEESELPLLVMELMDYNLHCYLLAKCNSNLPLSLRQSILEDVAKGLTYLHSLSDPIIHRDLTATNVLLNSALVAKISDFGNSRLLPNHFNPKKLSTIPGTALYMPPEASGDDYGTKLDIFSFGHLALFTLTQVFPDTLLGATYMKEELNIRAGRSEVERRADYFDILVGGLSADKKSGNARDHPLVVLVKECLSNEPTDRPTAMEIVESLQLKEYSKDLTQVAKKLAATEDEVKRLSTQLQQKSDQLESSRDDSFRYLGSQKFEKPPIHMSSHPRAVVIDDKVYIGGGYAKTKEEAATILVFDYKNRSVPWSTLPQCPTKYFGLTTTYDGKLAIVAGTDISGRTKTGRVYTWDPKQPQTTWEKFKCTSMLNYRSSVSVVSYGKWLIAAGGEGRDGMIIDSVEKLDTTAEENKCHWTSCSKLVTKSNHLSLTIVDDKVFAFCTNTKVPTSSVAMPSNAVFFASVTKLLESNGETPQNEVWQEIKNLPIKSSTAVSFKGSLLALGGLETSSVQNVSMGIYQYNEHLDNESPSEKWKKVGDLPYPIYQCASAEFIDGIFVYGKSDEDGTCVYMHSLSN